MSFIERSPKQLSFSQKMFLNICKNLIDSGHLKISQRELKLYFIKKTNLSVTSASNFILFGLAVELIKELPGEEIYYEINKILIENYFKKYPAELGGAEI